MNDAYMFLTWDSYSMNNTYMFSTVYSRGMDHVHVFPALHSYSRNQVHEFPPFLSFARHDSHVHISYTAWNKRTFCHIHHSCGTNQMRHYYHHHLSHAPGPLGAYSAAAGHEARCTGSIPAPLVRSAQRLRTVTNLAYG